MNKGDIRMDIPDIETTQIDNKQDSKIYEGVCPTVFKEDNTNKDYKLEFWVTVEVVIGGNSHEQDYCLGTSYYKPGDTNSIISALDSIADQICKATETPTNARITNSFCCFRRPDGTYIDEVDASSLKTTSDVIKIACIV